MPLKDPAKAKIILDILTPGNVKSINRESWLTQVAETIAPLFPCGLDKKPFRVTCGWPSVNGLGSKSQRVGECHALESSKAKVHEIFISPVLDDSLQVAGTLAHELAHIAAGMKAAHGKDFVKVCRYVGLTRGKPRCVMPGPLLESQLKDFLHKLPIYPHLALIGVPRAKKAGAGSVGLICTGEGCGCKLTMPQKWFTSVGIPTCKCGSLFKLTKDKDVEEE